MKMAVTLSYYEFNVIYGKSEGDTAYLFQVG